MVTWTSWNTILASLFTIYKAEFSHYVESKTLKPVKTQKYEIKLNTYQR